jgi:hypothetical protein
MTMEVVQVLAAPDGFVCKMRAQSGHLRLLGSDSGEWTRFGLGGVVPAALRGGDGDHARAAFGRYWAEAVFWSPAAVLPSPHLVREPGDLNTARVTVSYRDLTQSVDVTVAPDGQPSEVAFHRWSNANPA